MDIQKVLQPIAIAGVLCAALLQVTSARAEDGAVVLPAPGTQISPVKDLSAWSRTPEGFLGLFAEDVGVLDTGARLMVQDQKVLPTLSGKDVWLKVQPVPGSVSNAKAECQQSDCWVYWGKASADLKPNFDPIK